MANGIGISMYHLGLVDRVDLLPRTFVCWSMEYFGRMIC